MKLPKLQDLTKILTRLSKRDRIIFYTVAFLIFLLIFDRLIISTIYSKMHSLDSETQEKETGIKDTLKLLAQKNKIISESSKFAPFLSRIEFNEEQLPSFLKEIETLANKSSVYLIDLKPQGLKDVGQSKRYLISLNCEAQLEQLMEFMYNIENSNNLFVVGKYEIIPKSRESSIASCTMSIYKIIVQ